MTSTELPDIEKEESAVDEKVMEDINKTPARITLNGKRHYTTPLFTGPAPSK